MATTGVSLESLFGLRNISRSMERTLNGIHDPSPEVFQKKDLVEEVIGNETTFHTHYGERRLVQRSEYGGPSRATTQKKTGQVPVVLNSYSTHILVQQMLLLRLREETGFMVQREAVDFVTRAVKQHATRYANNRLAHRIQMLAYGVYWYDVNGNLLQSSGSSTQTEDLGVPAANKTNIGGIIDGTWSNVASNIYGHILGMQRRQVQLTGRPLKHAFYDTTTIPSYIYQNTSFKQYFQYNKQYYEAMTNTRGVIPNGFMDMQWHPMGECFFENEAETVVQLWPTNGLTLTPEITPDIYTRYVGSILVPKGVIGQAFNTPEQALKNTEMVTGIGGYSILREDPVSLKMTMVDNFLDTWKNPNDLVMPTVVF